MFNCRLENKIKMGISRVYGCGLDSTGSGFYTKMGYCKHGYENSGSTEGGEFLS